MTQAELEQLSRDVAEKYWIDAYFKEAINLAKWDPRLSPSPDPNFSLFWLHDDIGRCATLAIEHGVDIGQLVDATNGKAFGAAASIYNKKHYHIDTIISVHYANYNGNKIRATCVAILKALLAKA